MLELSMQPTDSARSPGGGTTYTWDYKRLLTGRPIALDVLGIAPIDRLGELTWLGPLSVIAFGLLLGIVSRAHRLDHIDRWMLMLILGTYTAAFPLMYFAQQFVRLPVAMLLSAAAVIIVIATRVFGIMGVRVGLFGVIIPAAGIMAVTLTAAVHPHLQ